MGVCARACVLSLVLSGLLLAAFTEAAEVPRYKLQVGQDLTYSGTDEFKYQSGKFVTETKWRVWVVRQNEDGSWRLIVRQAMKHRQERDAGGGGNNDETVTFAWTDLLPDGSITDNDSLGYRLNLYTLFIGLPPDAPAAASGWNSRNQRMDEVNRYQLLADRASGNHCAIQMVRESPMNEIYGFELEDVATFDCQRGLPIKIESRTKQTYGFNGEGKGTLQLDEVKQQSEEWCRGFLADAERYFAVVAKEPKGLTADAIEARDMQTTANRLAAKEAIKSPEFLKQIDDDLAFAKKYLRGSLETARQRYAMIGRPAAEWTCSDLDGNSHALQDYRGRVVVLDFWYRGCGWCVRAMPQMKQIAAHFGDRPVTIFGMNTDRQEEDARFVIEKMGLNYANLKATGIPEKYNVRGFPTLLILDQAGVVRDIHVGYSADLKEKVVESIEKLLAKQE